MRTIRDRLSLVENFLLNVFVAGCGLVKFIDNFFMAKQNLSVDDIFARLEEVESLKRQAIDQLLVERKVIDDKLAKLGYTGAPAPKKRHRRTKAEIEAARAAGQA